MIYQVIFLVVFLLLAFCKVPVPFAMGIGAIVTMIYAGGSTAAIPTSMFRSINVFTFLAIPAFIFAGDLMSAAGISAAIMKFAKSLVGKARAAEGAVTVITCALFGAITGSSMATITGIGGMMLPELVKAGYDKRYATALISVCGFLGILIPPSIPGILYAMMAGENIMKVWLCTVGPALILVVLYCIINFYRNGKGQPKDPEPFKAGIYFGNIGKTFIESLVALMMPLIIFVGIYGGVFTPTEAGAVAVAYGLLVGWVIQPAIGKAKGKPFHMEAKFYPMVTNSAITSSTIAMLNVFATVAGTMITYTRIPDMLTQAMFSLTDNKYIFLLIINLVLIVVGMFMETNSSILLFGPILIPVAQSYGVDTIHFAGIMLLNLEIGMITPPFAANIFVGCRVARLDMTDVLHDMWPFFGACIIVLIITTYCPAVVTWLPNLI